MKNSVLLALGLALPAVVGAQEAGSVEELRKELRELRQKTEQLEEKLKRLEVAPPTTPVPPTSAAAAPPLESKWTPGDPLTLLKGRNSYLNLSLDALFAVGGSTADDLESLQLGGHDPNQRGFTVQTIEAVFDGAIDPYLRGQANIIFLLDSEGETGVELEEAWMETTALPWDLTLRGGQILTDFGRHNSIHPHAWAFVDSPLVAARFLGPDGLRNPGARLSWLTPLPFYSDLSLSVQNSSGETATSFRNEHEGELYLGRYHENSDVRGAGDLLFAPRYAMSLDLTPSQTALFGLSGAFAPNSSGVGTDTRIYGADLYWKWKPVTQSGGFPFVAWQTEVMCRQYEAGAFTEIDDLNGNGAVDSVGEETIKDWGLYTQLTYGFRKGWVAGLRFDYVDRVDRGDYEVIFGDDMDRARRWRIAPNLTWYPSEFSKIRLQYNMDDRDGFGVDHSVWLQFEFLLGSHGAHKF